MTRKRKLDGMSSENSVTFFFYDINKGATATVEEGENLKVETFRLQRKEKKISGLIIFLLVSLIFREVFYHLDFPFLFYHIPTIIWTYIYISIIRSKCHKKELRRYHGAEHKVINWLNRENTYVCFNFEKVKRTSRICMYCGTNISATIATFQIISSICMVIYNIHIPDIIITILPVFVYGIFPFNILGILTQWFFTTSEPKVKHLYVAKEALDAIYNKEWK